MAKKNEEIIRLEKEAAKVEAFINEATPDQVRALLSSVFSSISEDLILAQKYPGAYMYDEDDGRYEDGKDSVRNSIYDDIVSWVKKESR